MSDKEIQQAVLRELEYEPQVRSTEIGVAVNDGVVTLSGIVDNYIKRYAAERAAKRVFGVKAVANDIEVKLPSGRERPDPAIARAAVEELESRVTIPHDRIKVTVQNGWVTLEGDVDWQYQKEAAEEAVRALPGVKGITNLMSVKPRVSTKEVKAKIEEALRRSAELDARRITVETSNGTVQLWGTVRSWIEREEAERAAWSAPGVKKVEDHIIVSP